MAVFRNGEVTPQINYYFSRWLAEGWNSLHGWRRNRQGTREERDGDRQTQTGEKKEKSAIHPAVNVIISEGNLRALVWELNKALCALFWVFSFPWKFLKALSLKSFFPSKGFAASHCWTVGEKTSEQHRQSHTHTLHIGTHTSILSTQTHTHTIELKNMCR